MTWPSNYLAVSYSQCDLEQREIYKKTKQKNPKKTPSQTNQTKKLQTKQWAEIFSLKKNKKMQ